MFEILFLIRQRNDEKIVIFFHLYFITVRYQSNAMCCEKKKESYFVL